MKTVRYRELGLAVATVALVAAGLGYLLFGPLGVVLWAPLAVTVTLLLYLLRGFSTGLAMGVPLLLAGAALYDSADLAWGGADAADGTRYKVTPIGLIHVCCRARRYRLRCNAAGTLATAMLTCVPRAPGPRQPISNSSPSSPSFA